jgi:phenylacetate-CoA ligase
MNTRACTLEQIQLEKFNYLLGEVWERNPFYTYKWCQAGVNIHTASSLAELRRFPLTTRNELLVDQQSTPPLGSNLTCPRSALKRVHRSSGNTRAPLYWADTPKTWAWVMKCSESLFLLAGLTPDDRILFTLPPGQSSGPSIMFEGACKFGCFCFTSGLSDTPGHVLNLFCPTVLVGRPSQLRELALTLGDARDARSCEVQKLIFTGEIVSATMRRQIEEFWNAESFDRYGLTEAGSVASECVAHPGGMHVLETEFIAEVIDPHTCQTVSEGAPGELVLTTLGRIAQPIIRYRTGDLVRLIRDHNCRCGRSEAMLVGGISRRRPMGNFSLDVPPRRAQV